MTLGWFQNNLLVDTCYLYRVEEELRYADCETLEKRFENLHCMHIKIIVVESKSETVKSFSDLFKYYRVYNWALKISDMPSYRFRMTQPSILEG